MSDPPGTYDNWADATAAEAIAAVRSNRARLGKLEADTHTRIDKLEADIESLRTDVRVIVGVLTDMQAILRDLHAERTE